MEGTHGQLGTGLTNGLGGNNTHSLTNVHALTGGQRTAIAGGAGTDGRVTGEHGTNHDGLDAGSHQLLNGDVADVLTSSQHHVALSVHGVAGQGTGVGGGLYDLAGNQVAGSVAVSDLDG